MGGEWEALARSASDGDPLAFASLVRLSQADVWRACAALVDPDTADDLAQETFLRAYRGLGAYAARSSVRTWLLAIARHVCLDELRARGRSLRLLRLLPAVPQHPEPGLEIELRMLLDDLPAERRVAFVLTQVSGLSYAEAAEVVGCPVGTIRSRVARAREQLVEHLSAAEPAPEVADRDVTGSAR